MVGDAVWYEAAMVVGITNALNVVADGLGPLMAPVKAGTPPVDAVYADIHAFYGGGEVPTPFGLAAQDAGYLADLWAATKRAFGDNALSRRVKTALAFAVSLTTAATLSFSPRLNSPGVIARFMARPCGPPKCGSQAITRLMAAGCGKS